MNGSSSRSTGVIAQGDPRSRALAIRPGLDRRKLARTCGDPHRGARTVERRTADGAPTRIDPAHAWSKPG
jgi:hypothetical protein